jgi:hypothetical protein
MQFLFIFFFSLLCANVAQAQTHDQTFKDWSVFKHQNKCYIASAPTSHTGSFRKRGQPYLMVVSKGAAGEEINASSGYPYAPRLDALLTLSGSQFKLYTQGNIAWAYDAPQDAALIAMMKQASTLTSTLTLRGNSQRKTWSEDTYSLAGFAEAYARMKGLCK